MAKKGGTPSREYMWLQCSETGDLNYRTEVRTKGGMDEKLKARAAMKPGDADPFIEPGACKALAANAMKGLDERVKQEQTTKKQ